MANNSGIFNEGNPIKREPAQPGVNDLRGQFDRVRGQFNTPPPASPVDISDLLARIESLMAPTPEAPPKEANLSNILQTLLNALPQAISVGISQDPGAALGQQLERLQAMMFQRELEAGRRKERLDEIRRMTGIDLIKGEISERRQISGEQRAQQFKLFERQEDQDFELRKMDLDIAARRKLQEENNDFLRSLDDVRYQRESIAQNIKRTTELALLGIPQDAALRISKTELSGLPITGEDKKLLDAAYLSEFGFQKKAKELGIQKELAMIEKLKAEAFQSRAQGRASMIAANAKEHAMNDTIKEIRQGNFVVDADGNLVPKALTDNMFGTTIQGKAVKYTDPRQVEAVFKQKYVIPDLQQDSNQNLKPTAVQGSAQSFDAASADQWLRDNINAGAKLDDLIKDTAVEPNPQIKKAKEDAIVRAKTAQEATEQRVKRAQKAAEGLPTERGGKIDPNRQTQAQSEFERLLKKPLTQLTPEEKKIVNNYLEALRATETDRKKRAEQAEKEEKAKRLDFNR